MSAASLLYRALKYSPCVLAIAAIGCAVETTEPLPRSGAATPPEDLRMLQQPMEAPCTINVEGSGQVSVEDDYIANVVACENGNAPMEALKAQAIQARGYLYYVLGTGRTTIGDSQDDQVYSCSYASAGPRHIEAARATRGQYLRFQGHTIAPFYVAGAIPANQQQGDAVDACVGAGGNDPTNTERWVTYNLGRTGCDIDMSPLGWIPGDGDCMRNPLNRGCASQNGQACLAGRGWFYEEMQPYYYGSDIEIVHATGSCGGPSTEPPNFDAYCMRHDYPTYCVDQTRRVHCNGDAHTAVEDCPAGCRLGECLEEEIDDDGFCSEAGADGWYCYGATSRVHCVDGELVETETCSAGCEDDLCLAPIGDGDGDGDGEPVGDGDVDADDPQPLRPGAAHLVTTSEGVTGGCNQSAGAASAASTALVLGLLLSLLAIGRRKRKTAYFVP